MLNFMLSIRKDNLHTNLSREVTFFVGFTTHIFVAYNNVHTCLINVHLP